MVRLTARLDMTIVVDWDIKQTLGALVLLHILIVLHVYCNHSWSFQISMQNVPIN